MVNQEAEGWLDRGYKQYERGDFEGAIASYDKAIKIKPDLYQAWYSRGAVLCDDLGRFKEALASFDKAIEIKPDFHDAWYCRGVVLLDLERSEEAIASFDKAIEIKPDYDNAWYNKGVALHFLERFEEAITSFDKAIEIKADGYEVWYLRGIALHFLGGNEEAIASFDKAIEIKADDYDAWDRRGDALLNLGRFEEAIVSFDKAIEIKADDYEVWNKRGIVLCDNLGRFEEAIASFDKAIKIKPDYHHAWHNRGVALANLRQDEEAIASYNKAIEIKPDYHYAYGGWGVALYNLGRSEEAIASYDKAIEIIPDFHEAWHNRGFALDNLGRFEEAIASYDKAIEFKPHFYGAWYNRGFALKNLRRFEDAIASYGKAIEIKPDFYEAWYDRGAVLCDNLRRFEEAIASFDKAIRIKPDYHIAWQGRSIAVGKSSAYNPLTAEILQAQFPTSPRVISNSTLNKRGYKWELLTLETGLQNFQQETPEHKLGRGRLHQAIGNAHYFQRYHKSSGFSFSQLCNKAINSYNQALKTLTKEDFPEERLEVLEDYIKALLSLHQTAQATQLQRDNKDLLRYLLAKTKNPTQQQRLEIKLKLVSFDQLTVDILVQSGQLIEALETAEKVKNTCLSWLFSVDDDSSPEYPEIQQLLNPATAAVYWHLSDYALHTFIIKSGESKPSVVGLETHSLTHFDEFKEWVRKWNKEYAKGKGEKQEGGAQTWRDNLEETLKELGNILNIAAIEEEVRGIKNLILIPHRDLHRFPIHALFGDELIISYLPSAKLGLGLAENQTSLLANEVKLLSIEHPESESEYEEKNLLDLPFATVESEYICRLFPNNQRLTRKAATLAEVETSLLAKYSIVHFTGHASYNFQIPSQSALCLTGKQRLRVENILQIDLSQCELVSLSACETAITGNQTITTEYVGLVSAFLSRGVSRVASTLWTVQSDAAGLVMMKFYQLRQDKSDVEALNEAARWLRDLTAGKLVEWYQAIMEELPKDSTIRPPIRAALARARKQTPDHKLYAHHYYWAPFIITGITR